MKNKKLFFDQFSLPKIYDLYDRYKDFEEPYEQQIFDSLPDDPNQLLAIVRSAGAAIAAIEDEALMTSNYFIFSQLTYIHARFKMSLSAFKPDSFLLECILNHPILFKEYFKLLVSSGEAKEPVPDPPIEWDYTLTPIGTEILKILKDVDNYSTIRFEQSIDCCSESDDSNLKTALLPSNDGDSAYVSGAEDDDSKIIHHDIPFFENEAVNITELKPKIQSDDVNSVALSEVKRNNNERPELHPLPEKISRTYADVLRHHEKGFHNNNEKPPRQEPTPLKCDEGRRATKPPFDKERYRKRGKSVYKRITERLVDDEGFVSFRTHYVRKYGPTPYARRGR